MGHYFQSLDIKDTSGKNKFTHIKEDFFHYVPLRLHCIDFLGAHPVCRVLANSGARWLASKEPRKGYEWSKKYQIYINPIRYAEVEKAACLFRSVLSCVKSVGKGYVENPILHKYAMELIGVEPSQIIQPWQFGHTTSKATCLWLVGLPELTPTEIIPKELRTDEIHKCPPGPERATIRSKTFPGIAKAMAAQWG